MPESGYENLIDLGRKLQLAGDAQALLSWDQEVLLPRKGIAYRAEQMSWLSGWTHERFIAPEVGEWIAEAGESASSEIEKANVREWNHQYERATRLPKEFVEEMADAEVRSKSAWAEAREKSDFSTFAPWLTKLVELSKKQAELWGYADRPYDALLDKFERGATTDRLANILSDLRKQLIPIVEEATAQEKFDDSFLRGEYPVEKQQAFNREVAELIGFDFDAGRIDTAVHPFCSGMGPFDTRLTTRYDTADFRSSLFGVLHEAGHGLYDQGLPEGLRGQPAGSAASLGVHESQSRLWENHVGRSRAFWEKWLPRAVHYFPNLKGVTVEQIFRAVNTAELSYIRVESDEVTYDLHVLLRFELEQLIFSGDLDIADIPGEWNSRFEKYFGLPVTDDAKGCLQDIHWSMGIFGYFPTYSLGNINAAHLAKAAKNQEPGLTDAMQRGDYSGLLSWMKKKIHQRGSILMPDDLVTEAAGSPANADALVEHLKQRYIHSS